MEYASDDLTEAVDLRVAELGFELVDARKRVSRNRTVLQVRIDRQQAESGGGITADDCAFVSRGLETWFDESGVLGDRYVLEVSSPGLDRPLKKPADFERFAGQPIKLKTLHLLDPDQRGHSRKTFFGTLLGFENDHVRLEQSDKKGGLALIPLDEIEKANLEEEF